jgi:acetyl/propionyl-CoA carboxylase alpha subunit
VLEARLYAEDPLNAFLPSSGTLKVFDLPAEKHIRADSGYRAGNTVGSWYDPMLAKLIVQGDEREDARRKMIEALEKTYVDGLSTNRDFLIGLLRSDSFKENRIHTGLLDTEIQDILASMAKQRAAFAPDILLAAACFISLYQVNEGTPVSASPWHQIGHWRMLPGITITSDQEAHFIPYRWQEGKQGMRIRIRDHESSVTLEQRKGSEYRLRIDGQLFQVWGRRDRSEILLDMEGHRFTFRRPDIPDRRYIPGDQKQEERVQGEISAPLNGRVVEIRVKEGERVAKGEALIVIESMKMENLMLSDQEAHVKQIEVSVGQQVRTNQILLTLASI